MQAEPTTQLTLEKFFEPFRENIIGINDRCTTAYGDYPIVYADWIAEGRLYGPIEEIMSAKLGPFVSNPHSYASYTGQRITEIYQKARSIIRDHVNASSGDILVTTGHGMTGALQHFIQILDNRFDLKKNSPIVFISHMEHHSNHTTWQQAGVELVVLKADSHGLPDRMDLRDKLKNIEEGRLKIGSFTACSNVTGLITPYGSLAEEMHAAKGYCFVDFAASAPYVEIDMHPSQKNQYLDAIFFAPHKFLGGPGSCGVLVFNKELHNGTPTFSGGGNVRWTQPGGSFGYTKDIEAQEDGGTPAYMQTIRTALSIRLKEKMGINRIREREHELLSRATNQLKDLPEVELLGCEHEELEKIGALSFNIKGLHYNLIVKILNDRFGIQTRGGWSCASTYGHYLFDIPREDSDALVERIENGNLTGKPGWIRLSLHPTMSDNDLTYCLNAIHDICQNGNEWAADYFYNSSDNEYYAVNKENHSSQNHSDIFNI